MNSGEKITFECSIEDGVASWQVSLPSQDGVHIGMRGRCKADEDLPQIAACVAMHEASVVLQSRLLEEFWKRELNQTEVLP